MPPYEAFASYNCPITIELDSLGWYIIIYQLSIIDKDHPVKNKNKK